MKKLIEKIPIFGNLVRTLYKSTRLAAEAASFPGSKDYWEKRYAAGGNSGVGSYGKFAEFKAEVINAIVVRHRIGSVIEFGCGDGNQLLLAKYPSYLGVDVSEAAIAKCTAIFAHDSSKRFIVMGDYMGEKADLALSLDVLYHLVEDEVFENYMRALFGAAKRYVIVYSSDTDDNADQPGSHVRQRKFTDWIQRYCPQWQLMEHIPNRYPYSGDYMQGSFADFFLYAKA